MSSPVLIPKGRAGRYFYDVISKSFSRFHVSTGVRHPSSEPSTARLLPSPCHRDEASHRMPATCKIHLGSKVHNSKHEGASCQFAWGAVSAEVEVTSSSLSKSLHPLRGSAGLISQVLVCPRCTSSRWAPTPPTFASGTLHPVYHPQWGPPRRSSCAVPRQPSAAEASDKAEEKSNVQSFQEPTAAVDTSGLHRSGHAHSRDEEEGLSDLERHLAALIRFRGGPISVAEYMEQALTHPVAGYYMQKDVFGISGDFVTSPDISQMFGEMIGVWVMCTWEQLGRPSKFQLVELGPGRGALMADLLRSTSKFQEFASALSRVALVEVSPALRLQQQAALAKAALLCGHGASGAEDGSSTGEGGASHPDADFDFGGTPVQWYSSFSEVPSGEPLILIAHEFFDALPIHQFQRTPRGWCEKLVDISHGPVVVEGSGKLPKEKPSTLGFRFVLSPGPTAAVTLALQPRLKWAPEAEASSVQQVEVGSVGVRMALDVARRIGRECGAALVVDYGQDGLISDSLRAIRQHRFVGVLDRPGSADVSADVDFAALMHAVNESDCGAEAFGPITQSSLLGQLGINFRLESLLDNATEEQAEALQLAYWRLVGDGTAPWLEDGDCDEGKAGSEALQDSANDGSGGTGSTPTVDGMGTQYKAMAFIKRGLGPPICFK